MAMSINEILKSAKIEGMELSKIKTENGNYFLAEYRGREHSIMVNSLGQMERAQWVEALKEFAAEVDSANESAEEATEGGDAEGDRGAPAEEATPAPRPTSGYVLIKTEARSGSKRRAFADWLNENPGASKKAISRAGHNLADLRYHVDRGWVEKV